MGGYGGDAEIPVGVPPPGGQADSGDKGYTWGGPGVVISPGSGGTGNLGNTPHNVVHSEAAGNHSGKGDIPPHL